LTTDAKLNFNHIKYESDFNNFNEIIAFIISNVHLSFSNMVLVEKLWGELLSEMKCKKKNIIFLFLLIYLFRLPKLRGVDN